MSRFYSIANVLGCKLCLLHATGHIRLTKEEEHIERRVRDAAARRLATYCPFQTVYYCTFKPELVTSSICEHGAHYVSHNRDERKAADFITLEMKMDIWSKTRRLVRFKEIKYLY